jgi:hypothetical protein
MGCMIPHPFAAGGNRSYPEFRVVTDDPQYPYIFIYIYIESKLNVWVVPLQ